MWIEREHDRGPAYLIGFLQQLFPNCQMAAMYAIEIADRHGAAASVGRQRFEMSNNVHMERGARSMERKVRTVVWPLPLAVSLRRHETLSPGIRSNRWQSSRLVRVHRQQDRRPGRERE